MNLLLFIGILFFLIVFAGYLLEKYRIPWLYSALFLGIALSGNTLVKGFATSSIIKFLSEIGMLFLLFSIGFNLKIKEILNARKFIAKITFWVVLSESGLGILLLHFMFNLGWLTSGIIAASFATVGEAALLPILKEFKLIKTKLGQTILSVGVLDDIIEVTTFALAMFYINSSYITNITADLEIFLIITVFILAILLFYKFFPHSKIRFKDNEFMLLISLAVLFTMAGLGQLVDLSPLAAIASGMLIYQLIAKEDLKKVADFINLTTFEIFAPFFFFTVGMETNINALRTNIFLILGLTLIIKVAKILPSYLIGKKIFGPRKAVVMGISLCIKFSTSIIILVAFLNRHLITTELFSILIGVKVAFKLVVPLLLSFLLKHWQLKFETV